MTNNRSRLQPLTPQDIISLIVWDITGRKEFQESININHKFYAIILQMKKLNFKNDHQLSYRN